MLSQKKVNARPNHLIYRFSQNTCMWHISVSFCDQIASPNMRFGWIYHVRLAVVCVCVNVCICVFVHVCVCV